MYRMHYFNHIINIYRLNCEEICTPINELDLLGFCTACHRSHVKTHPIPSRVKMGVLDLELDIPVVCLSHHCAPRISLVVQEASVGSY